MRHTGSALDDPEKSLLQRRSVFSGGFDLQSVCAVVGSDDIDEYTILDLLDALVRKSLLIADRSSERTRLSMLETIRQFAACAAHGRGVPAAAGAERGRRRDVRSPRAQCSASPKPSG
jgi:predicted ATPase